ncbi:phytanoyl-CoA dioxygenase family protein [Deinococcus pimensis]|uniref:phytanoyl-CoA dioxygenase family protein n=1 Tax=Deinococcus pimensis TaxID=309888 RepID=UPI0004ACFCAC|nr:phytanoyl-CoA dioxygenase family protein [Deinococcus pimensis]
MTSTPTVRIVDHPPRPEPVPPRTPHHLTEEQVRFFDEHGYLVLRRWITGPLLERLSDAGHAWIEEGRRHPERAATGDYNFARRAHGDVLFRVNYLHDKGQSASLELLGDARVLAVAESLCGPDFVPTYESMVFKDEGDGEKIPWHQDAVHPRRTRVFNLDLYLDRSSIGAGALRVVPGTQKGRLDPCEIAEKYGWDAPGVIQVEMEPGDVLLHDVMVLHGSEPTAGNALRRTVYLEFRAAEGILEDGPWDEAWIEKRLRLVPVAMRAHERAFPHGDRFEWNVSPHLRPAPLGDDETELKVAHVVHTPGSWCSAGDAGKTS